MFSVHRYLSVHKRWAQRVHLFALSVGFICGSAACGSTLSSAAPDEGGNKARLADSYGKVPLSFEPNRGQTDARVQFLSRGPGYGIFLTPGEAVLSFKGQAGGQSVLQMKLVGANTGAAAEAEDKLPGTANYMKGTDRSKWATGVPTYGKVKYAEVYPGVDLVFYGNQRQLEYDFVVAPGQDAGRIALEFAGVRPVVDEAGDLVLGTGGDAKFHKPVVYQMRGGERLAVAGAYEVEGQRVRFRLGRYDHSRTLVIDPVVTYLTYLGGASNDAINAIALDSSGAAYLAGTTMSTDFPLKGAIRSTIPSGDSSIFVTKLNQSGTSIVYSTYLASNGNTIGNGIAVDSSGSAYVAGGTDTDGFPVTSGAFQTLCGGNHDASGNRTNGCVGAGQGDNGGVLAKLSADGASIVYATYLGGNNYNVINAVAVDSAGEAYVTGQTNAHCGTGPYSGSGYEPFQCFPTTNGSAQSTTEIPGGGTLNYAFFTKFDAAGATEVYSSILGPDPNGPSQTVAGYAIAVNSNGFAYITGAGGNTLYTTDGSFQQTGAVNGNSAFVAEFDPAEAELLYSTYLGGTNRPYDVGRGIAADEDGNAYVTGYTHDCDFPTTAGAYDTVARYAPTDTANVGRCNAGFVAKVNPSGNGLVWATYLGDAPLAADNNAQMAALALGPDGSVYVAGAVQGGGYPSVNPVLPQQNNNNVGTVTQLSADGSSALFSTTIGGPISANETATAVAVDSTGAIYVAGSTNESELPTTNGVVQPAFAGAPGDTTDGFIAKISPATPPQPSNGLTNNLLANPGAELGSIANWTVGGGGTPTVDTGTFDEGINPHTGTYDFIGHDGAADSLAQTVSIIQQGITASQVDGGTLFAKMSFWEQGLNQGSTSDDGFVTLTFLNANNAAISTVNSGEVDSHDGTWANFTSTYAIPVGTRSITYTMNFMRHVGSDLDSFIDDNSLSIVTDTGLTIFPGRLHFGSVAVGSQSTPQTVSVTNQQTSPINIQQILSELGSNPSDFIQTNNCPTVLESGASCTLTITFVPDGVGAKSAGIAINTDSVPPLQQVSVDGTGTGGILQVNPGNLKTIAGTGVAGTTGNGGPAIMANLNQPNGVAFDPSGNLYIADTPANVVRKVDTSGTITTFAGVGVGGFTGDGGLATQAELRQPFSVASDANGNIYIQDTGNYVVRKVDTSGIITTFAGTPQTPGHAGDGGPATAARFNQNQGARFDSAGNLYVPQCLGASIRKIDTAGNISTVAGNFTEGFSGDGGQATAAELQCPSGVTIDAAGNFYIADEFNQVIRKVNTQGVISTIAGTPGVAGFAGDGGVATAATFNNPNDVVIDAAGNLYVADSGNNRVRKIDTNCVITTAAGGLNNAGSAAVNTPLAVTLDTAGNVYFSDAGNSKVEEIFPQGVDPFPATVVGGLAAPKTLAITNIGNVTVTIPQGSFSVSGNAADFSLTDGSCLEAPTIIPGHSCTLEITFTPTAAGLRTATISVSDNALNSPQSFVVSGVGTASEQTGAVTPTITWATPAPITDATPLSATQLNATATDANGATVPGTFVYTPAADALLNAGTQTLSVTFTPTNQTAFTSATSTVQIVVTLGPSDNLSPSVVAFPRQTVGTASKAVAINVNVYSAVLQNYISVTGDFSQTNTCGADYGYSGTNCYIQVTFTPTATGARTGTLLITPPSGPSLTVALSGAGLAAGTLPGTTSTALGVTGAAGNYTFTGTVTGSLGVGAPTGSVSFVDTTASDAVLGVATLGAPTTSTGLANGPSMMTGFEPFKTATADFNGDGRPDLAILYDTDSEDESNCQQVNIRLSNGDGTFTAKPDLPVAYCAATLAIGDFNGDGRADIALSPSGTGSIVYFGNGDGTFTARTIAFDNFGALGAASGDFNGDGRSDLVFMTSVGGGPGTSGATMTVLLGQADGTFVVGMSNSVTFDGNLAVADFNGDGKADVEYLTRDGSTVTLGNGDGTFQAPVSTSLQGQGNTAFDNSFYSVSVGDFNGDGKADLVFSGTVGDGGADAFLVLISKGDGTFTVGSPVQTSTTTQGDSNDPVVAVADFNGDGLADIAYLDDFAAQVFLSHGDGTFSLAAGVDSGDSGTGRAKDLSVVAADFNGDGLADILGVDSETELATVFFTERTETVQATLTGVSVPGSGSHLIEAVYAGDSRFLTSTSPPQVVTATSVPIVVGGPTLTLFTPAGALLGSRNTTITVIGTGFAANSVVRVNGAAVATTYVNPTTLMAVVPAAYLNQTGTLQVAVADPSIDAVSAALAFVVVPVLPVAALTGPSTAPPGSQPSIGLTIANPYPLPLTAAYSLSFAAATTPATDDPSVEFSNGRRFFSYTADANSTAVPAVDLQAGTIEGTITIAVTLTADGVDVTPAGLAPLVIQVPAVVPVLSGTTVMRSGTTLTVVIHGFSNTREVSQAKFEFTPVTGSTLATTDLTLPATTIFSDWYGSAASEAYGSTFTYTQVFDTSDDATRVGAVKVTLTNSVGASTAQTSQ